MSVFTVSVVDEFENTFKMRFESLSEAQECFLEWFLAHESGETPLYDLKLSLDLSE